MIKMVEYASFEEEVTALFNQVLTQLPVNTGLVRAEKKGDGTTVRLTPRNEAAASIWAHVINGLDVVYFGFGEFGNTWELPIEGYSNGGKQELLQEIKEMCFAIIAGNCSHRRGILSVTGEIRLGSRKYRLRDLLEFPRSLRIWEVRNYAPYVGRGSA
jgi:hypothetical protein